jgi:hypothetical protein
MCSPVIPRSVVCCFQPSNGIMYRTMPMHEMHDNIKCINWNVRFLEHLSIISHPDPKCNCHIQMCCINVSIGCVIAENCDNFVTVFKPSASYGCNFRKGYRGRLGLSIGEG